MSDDNVPRGTIHPKSPKSAVGKVNGSRRVEVVGCSMSDDNVPRGTINPKSAKRAVGKK